VYRHSLSIRLGDYRRVLMAGMEVVSEPVALLTVSPPGNEALSANHDSYVAWNRSAAKRWGKLDRRVKARLRREGLRVVPLLRVAQRQRRGVDHLHVGLRAAPGDERANRRYAELLKEHAADFHFGFVDDPYRQRYPKGSGGKPDRSKPRRDMIFRDPAIVGRYLVRYLSDSGQLQAMVSARDHSFRPIWLAPAITQASGVNCRRLRRVRHAYWIRKALDQGSRPTLPVWWADLRERTSVLLLLRPSISPAGP
jgi:hypothetical protein